MANLWLSWLQEKAPEMTDEHIKARIANLDAKITILAAKVVPLLSWPSDRKRYEARLRVGDDPDSKSQV